MKKMKKLLLLLLVVTSSAVFAQQLTWRFNNAQLVNGDTQLQFDVEVAADVAGTYALALTTVAFEYNTLGFGPNIYPGAITVDRGTLLLDELAPGSYLNAVQGLANTFSNTFSVSTQTNFPGFDPTTFPAFYTFFPDVFTQMYTITIDILDPGQVAGIQFAEYLMDGQQFYQGSAISLPMLDPNFYDNDLLTFPLGGGTGTPGLWTGAADDGDWWNPANWDDGNVPLDGDDVTIPVLGKATYPTISGGLVTTGTLTIAAAASLTIDWDGELTTNGLFTNDGAFTILSDGTSGYSGTYIDGAGVAGAGMFYFERYIPCLGVLPGTPDPYGWHYLSAPIDGLTSDDLPEYFINVWDQPTGNWQQYSTGVPCTPWPTTPLNAGEVWSVNVDLLYPYPACPGSAPAVGPTVVFDGFAADVHTGTYNTPLGYGAAGFQMWNLVANPFPSGLDLNTITWGPNTVAGAALWDGCPGNYLYWSPATGPYSMPVGNGFFVETTAADVFTVDNSNRAHGADFYYKEDITSLLTLEATGDGTSDILHVRFMENTTPGFDNNGDFHKLFATTEGLAQIYTVAGDHQLAINALPATEVVPMGFTANSSGTYTIGAIETSEFTEVYLIDLVTGESTDLLNASYTFEYTLGDDANRFEIHFGALGIGDNAANAVSIWSSDNKVYVQTATTDRGDIVVYNMMGQEVVRTDIAPGLNIIPMDEVNTYYVVKVLTNDKAVTGKVYIK